MSKMSKVIAVLGVVAGIGVAALPLSSYAATTTGTNSATDDVTAQVTVGDSIAITVPDAAVTMTSAGGGSVMANQEVATGAADITVQTNDAYKVEIKATETTNLKSSDANNTTSIPAGVPKKGESFWGYKSSSMTATIPSGVQDSWQTITTDNVVIAEKSSATATDGDKITLTFGVTVGTEIPADTYSTEVTLTATTVK